MKRKSIYLCVAFLLFLIPLCQAQGTKTSTSLVPFDWAVKSKYVDNFSGIIFNGNFSRDIEEKVLIINGFSSGLSSGDEWLYGKVYLAHGAGYIKIYFPEDRVSAQKTTASDAKCYVYIPSEDLQMQILNDLKSLNKTTIKNINKKFVIMLGTKQHKGMGKTTYSW